MTYFTSLNYTNYTLVTDWFVAGNEIADHTYVLPPLTYLQNTDLYSSKNDTRGYTPCR